MHQHWINSQSRKQKEHQLIFKLKNADITACWGYRNTSGPAALADFFTLKRILMFFGLFWTWDLRNFDAFSTIVQFQ